MEGPFMRFLTLLYCTVICIKLSYNMNAALHIYLKVLLDYYFFFYYLLL